MEIALLVTLVISETKKKIPKRLDVVAKIYNDEPFLEHIHSLDFLIEDGAMALSVCTDIMIRLEGQMSSKTFQ